MSAGTKTSPRKGGHRDARRVRYHLGTHRQLVKWIRDFHGVIVFPSQTSYSQALAGVKGKADNLPDVFSIGNLTVMFINGGMEALWKEREDLAVFAGAVARLNQDANPMKDLKDAEAFGR